MGFGSFSICVGFGNLSVYVTFGSLSAYVGFGKKIIQLNKIIVFESIVVVSQ